MNTYFAIRGTLTARTAIHIGTGEGGDVTDDLCRRNAEGDYLIPGTAIGGVLRTIATRLAPRLGSPICRALWSKDELKKLTDDQKNQPCGCWTCHLFGDINPGESDTEKTGGRASRLFVAHASLLLPNGKSARIRDGVGIDRASRAAARAGSVKFDLEVLPAGSSCELRLELEDANENDARLLAAVLAEWQAGRAWLGGRVGRGLGGFDLNSIKVVERDLSIAYELMAFLRADKPWEADTIIANWLTTQLDQARQQIQGGIACYEGVARSFVTVRFNLKIDGPFLTNDTTAAGRSSFDHAPLLDLMGTKGRPILAGASLRGVLRSQAERIARTLTTLAAANRDDFLAKCPACDPVESRLAAALTNCDTLLREVAKMPDEQEVSHEQLCLACSLFGSTRLGSRLIVEDAEADADTLRKVLDFLAIDRFTGGGKEGAKYDALALWKPVFAVRLYLENPTTWELGWLTLVLRDLADGMLPVGFGAAKGFGQAKIDSFTVHYGFINDDDFMGPVGLVHAHNQAGSGLYRLISWDTSDKAQGEQLFALAKGWVAEFNGTCKAFRRQANLALKEDHYFYGDVAELYERQAYRCLLNP